MGDIVGGFSDNMSTNSSVVNLEKDNKFYKYMYYVLVLFALASNIAPVATLTAIILGIILFIYHRIAFKCWPAIDKGFAKAFGIYFLVWIVIALNSEDIIVSINDVMATFYRFFPLFFVMVGLRNRAQLKVILLALGISVIITDSVAVYQGIVKGISRPEGMSNNTIFLASHMIMALSVGTAVILDKGFSKQWKIVTMLLGIMAFCTLLLTLTRGVWITLPFMLLLFVVLYPGNRKKIIKGGLVACLAALVIFIGNPTLQTRVQSISSLQDRSNIARIMMWKSSIEMVKDYPVFGVGPDRFQYVYNTKYILPLAGEKMTLENYHTGHSHPHNNFFKRLTEGGIVGGLAFVLLTVYVFRRLYKKFRMGIRENRFYVYSMMGIVMFAGMHIAGLTDTNVIIVPEMRELWFLIGLFMVADDLKLSD